MKPNRAQPNQTTTRTRVFGIREDRAPSKALAGSRRVLFISGDDCHAFQQQCGLERE